MAPRGSRKALSVAHEDYTAKLFDGRRSKSSGAADHESGDVICPSLRIECKMTQVSRPLPRFVREFEKIAEEAWESGKTPVLALRFWAPNSPLAHADGWVDLTLMIAEDMADRDEVYQQEIKGSAARD